MKVNELTNITSQDVYDALTKWNGVQEWAQGSGRKRHRLAGGAADTSGRL